MEQRAKGREHGAERMEQRAKGRAHGVLYSMPMPFALCPLLFALIYWE